LRPNVAQRWRAFYSLDLDEHGPIAEAAADFPAMQNYFLSVEQLRDGSLGDAQLTFDLTAESKEELVDEAERLFSQVRERAGLDRAVKRLLAVASVTQPPWELALHKAHQRFKNELHEEAVVFAQVACETRGTDALRSLLAATGVPEEVVLEFVRSTNLRGDHERSLLKRLTGVQLRGCDWWPEYRHHCERRNVIVHQGGVVTRAQADRSLDVAHTFCDYVGELADKGPQG
jgi:hypothetical protein